MTHGCSVDYAQARRYAMSPRYYCAHAVVVICLSAVTLRLRAMRVPRCRARSSAVDMLSAHAAGWAESARRSVPPPASNMRQRVQREMMHVVLRRRVSPPQRRGTAMLPRDAARRRATRDMRRCWRYARGDGTRALYAYSARRRFTLSDGAPRCASRYSGMMVKRSRPR